MKRKTNISLLIITSLAIVVTALLGAGYSWWNAAPPERTCASCHEIGSSVNALVQSSHRDLKCSECHGTALSNGFHSLKEKGRMVLNHIKEEHVEELRLNEEQLMLVMKQCQRCHSAQYANWLSGGHSVDYRSIFTNPKQNSTELLNFDCLRCHGMFFDGKLDELVHPINTTGPWKMVNEQVVSRPAIPCMACHLIHQPGNPAVRPNYSDPKAIFYEHNRPAASVHFYDRNEKKHFSVENLPELKLWNNKRQVNISDNVQMLNCTQCHAPNVFHTAGSSDDRTPIGVHEGLSCKACHEPHGNNARNSCLTCHPVISNCGLDVETMNTSFLDRNSPHNIHRVSCNDCHEDRVGIKAKLN